MALMCACGLCARLADKDQYRLVNEIERALEYEWEDDLNNMMMNWDQVKLLHANGHIIGSHTKTHPNLAYVEQQQAVSELVDSKLSIESHLNAEIHHFSYPSPFLCPHCNGLTREGVKYAGYTTAVTCVQGAVRRNDDLLCLKRIFVPNSIHDLEWNIQNAFIGRNV